MQSKNAWENVAQNRNLTNEVTLCQFINEYFMAGNQADTKFTKSLSQCQWLGRISDIILSGRNFMASR